jgi:hypothetical protein
MGPCHNSMACPQVADVGMASSYWGGGGGSCEYIEYVSSHRQTTWGGPPAWGLAVELTTLHRKKINLLRKTK